MKKHTFGIILFSLFISVGWMGGLLTSIKSVFTRGNAFFSVKNLHPAVQKFDLNSDYVSANQTMIDILHYDLQIDLYPIEKLLRGVAELTGIVKNNNLSNIDLNFYDNMKIKELTLNGVTTAYKSKGTRLSIFTGGASLDTFKIKIIYEGKPKRAGLSAFVFGEINNNSIVYNLNEPNYASTWFPCNDIPSDKALLDMRITNDTSKISVSNGILISKEINNNRATYHWKTLYPISTYLICLYSASYVEFGDEYISSSSDTMPIKYYVLPNHVEPAKVDFKSTPNIIKFFSKTFGEYPFIREKYGIAEFLWQIGAMEHQTITGIGTNFVTGKNYFEDVYIHELAHHWWGNAVGPAEWKDIWLNEGFATYSEALYEESKGGKKALQTFMLSKFSDNFSGTLYDPGDNLFSSTVYDKGAWVLHMLRWEVGDSVFMNILQSYFEEFKFQNASTVDFIAVAENISGRDLSKFFDQWVFIGEENIQLDYRWKIKSTSNGEYLILLDLIQKQEDYPPFNFKLEVKLEYDDQSCSKFYTINEKEKRIEILVPERPNQLILDPNNWLLVIIKDRNSYEY